MRAMMCLGAVLFLASCDGSKQELANTQSTLNSVTKERDDLKAKVLTLQEQLNTTKTQLAAAKSAPATGALAAKTAEPKSTPNPANAKSAKSKHAHKS